MQEIRNDGGDVSHFIISSDPLRVDSMVYVSSWTKDIEESDDLWNSYAPHGRVVIKSIKDKLEKVTVNDRFRVYCDDVIYPNDNMMDSPQPPQIKYMKKDTKSIKDNEFRALIFDTNQGDYIDIPVNLNDLLTGVIVHNIHLEVVQKLLDKNDVNVKATMSQLTGS